MVTMKIGMSGLVSLVAAVTAALASTIALAQAYPVKPIRLIVPSNPGGGTDVSGRLVGRILTEALGVQVVVENRGQATGRVGADAVARAAPDGYMLLLGATTPLSTIPSADPKVTYDPVKDFAPISLVATSDFALAVHASLPTKTVRDFIALARSKPGQINFASVGTGSGAHFTLELFKQLARLDMLHVPYRGASLAITALVGGEVSSYFGSGPSLLPHVKSGRVRPLASTGVRRMKTFPEIPTMNEIVPGLVSYLWFGVVAPAGTPNDIIARLFGVIAKGVHDPAMGQVFAAAGADPVSSSSPQEFGELIKTELAKWTKVAKTAGITVD
jgi:tripartite-type tricarboxylate transporter receptor subunit TctC